MRTHVRVADRAVEGGERPEANQGHANLQEDLLAARLPITPLTRVRERSSALEFDDTLKRLSRTASRELIRPADGREQPGPLDLRMSCSWRQSKGSYWRVSDPAPGIRTELPDRIRAHYIKALRWRRFAIAQNVALNFTDHEPVGADRD